jgi:serine/threonine-protein kinase
MPKAEAFVKPGEVIGPYKVVRAFRGHGGMAQVCEVKVRDKYYEPSMPKRLALKIADDTLQHALVAEAEYLSRFDHPNVVRIFPLPGFQSRAVYATKERFDVGWRWYYAMELLDGGSLEHRLTHPTTTLAGVFRSPGTWGQPLSLAPAVGIAQQLAQALDHIHSRQVINLDVKPGNVLFRRRRGKFFKSSVPKAVLADFGIARDPRHPRFGVLGIATPEYMSPEHAREVMAQPNSPLQTNAPVHVKPPDHRSDLFSLGVLLYEILTGVLPFEDIGTLLDREYTPRSPQELRPRIPQKLEDVVMRALIKDPDARYQSAADMSADLERVRPVLDWGLLGRRLFAGVTIGAVVAGGILAAPHVKQRLEDNNPQSSQPTTAVGAPSTATATPRPSATPVLPTSTPEAKVPARMTSTPKPTSTPTNTPIPVTPTSTATPRR